ncbi:sensor histidine kinase [Kocuria sp. CPCC 205263]|uniref:sensor histidine kinase n=1 Tax=Kocuria sp. CPCC 205263 TaxID=3073555 RepID=UPI0034D526E8
MNTSPSTDQWPARPLWLLPVVPLDRLTTVISVLALVAESITVPGHPPEAYIGIALSAIGVALARRHRLAGLVLVATAPLLAALLGLQPLALWTVAIYQAFSVTSRGASGLMAAAVVGAANYTAVSLSEGTFALGANPLASVAVSAAVAAAAAGSALCAQHQYWSSLQQRAQEALDTREAAVRRSVAEERVRIARDLHDSIGHRVAVVSMRLGAAEVHLPPGAAAAQEDLAQARTGIQDVLGEMQQILQVLRVDTPEEADQNCAPTPDLSHLPELVDSFRAGGMDLEAHLVNDTGPIAAHVSSAAYRITQEALTNAHKHGVGTVWLTLDHDEKVLTIEVTNLKHSAIPASTGRPPTRPLNSSPGAAGGHGVIGMRERARSTGGHLTIDDEDLFRLRAQLPVHGKGTP